MMDLPDPEYTSSDRSKRNFLLAVRLSTLCVGLLGFVFIADQLLDIDFVSAGLKPRELSGLVGIVTTPLLHASLEHLLANLIPLWVGLSLLLYLYPNSSVLTIPIIYLGSGSLVWLLGRDAIHVGASGFVYGIFSLLLVSGFLRRDLRSIGVSLMVMFVYGSMAWGLIPLDASMSWELHLAGTSLGVALAIGFRRWDRPPMLRYDWEDEE